MRPFQPLEWPHVKIYIQIWLAKSARNCANQCCDNFVMANCCLKKLNDKRKRNMFHIACTWCLIIIIYHHSLLMYCLICILFHFSYHCSTSWRTGSRDNDRSTQDGTYKWRLRVHQHRAIQKQLLLWQSRMETGLR